MPKLTDRYLATLTVDPPAKDRLVFDSACPGLGVRVTVKGTRTFIAQWTDPATRRKVREPLGVWGNLTIEQAREATRAKLGAVAKGIDPKAERLRQRAEAERERAEAALTFEALIEEWSALHLAQKREGYRAEAIRAIKYAFPELLKRPASRISRTDATNALDRLLMAGKAPTAARTRAYASSCFGWAVKRGKLAVNPFAGLPIEGGHNQRDRVLDNNEIHAIWNAAGELSYPTGPFIRLALLTLQRRSEVAAMRWSEIQGSTWQIPGARMKRGQPHAVHLSQAALDILAEIPRFKDNDLVFLGEKSGAVFTSFAGAKERVAALLPEDMPGWTFHDFRRAGVTWLAEAGFDSAIVDRLLAHNASGLTIVGRTYQSAEHLAERERALDAWASHVTGEPLDNVIALPRAAG